MQRTSEILDAYARCVRKHGLEGATLERVAEESGYSRGHVRHYLGNRDEMRSALIARTLRDYNAQTQGIVERLAEGHRAYAFVDLLFGPAFAPNADDPIIDALWGAASYDDLVKKQLRDNYLELEKEIFEALRGDFPGASVPMCRDAAYQLLALAYGHWSMSGLAFPANRQRGARRLATSVIERVAAASSARS